MSEEYQCCTCGEVFTNPSKFNLHMDVGMCEEDQASTKYMSLRKWNTTKLLLRILAFPFKLTFQIAWGVISSVVYSFKWLKNGSEEIVYGDDHGTKLTKIIEQNERILKNL